MFLSVDKVANSIWLNKTQNVFLCFFSYCAEAALQDTVESGWASLLYSLATSTCLVQPVSLMTHLDPCQKETADARRVNCSMTLSSSTNKCAFCLFSCHIWQLWIYKKLFHAEQADWLSLIAIIVHPSNTKGCFSNFSCTLSHGNKLFDSSEVRGICPN